MTLESTVRCADDKRVRLTIDSGPTLESVRAALDDPIWLIGATWVILTTNDFKKGRFDDAFGAWAERHSSDYIVDLLRDSGATVAVLD